MINRRTLVLSFSLVTSLGYSTAHGASFNCGRANSSIEKTICGNAAISELDSALAIAYRRALKHQPAEQAQLSAEQRAWLKSVRDKCTDSTCLATAYAARQAELDMLLQDAPGAIRQVVLGDNHSCSLDVKGAVWCRGENKFGQIGNGRPGVNVAYPVRVIPSGVTDISAAFHNTCAIRDGALYCWGANHEGQVGNDSAQKIVPLPAKVIDRGVAAVSTGRSACAIVDGALYCWGNNQVGQLGRAPSTLVRERRPVRVIEGAVTAVSSGGRHVCAVVKETLNCWGDNHYGQVGNGSTRNWISSPVPVELQGVTAVSAGDDHTCAISDGAVYCWGNNFQGILGLDTKGDDVSRPTKVIDAGVSLLSAGGHHTCAILSDTLKCWGSNFGGEVGVVPLTRVVDTPTQVIDRGVTNVATWGRHTCAVVNGAQQCWRYSGFGEIDPKPPRAATFLGTKPGGNSGAGLDKFLGTFKGTYIGNGGEFVITRLRHSQMGGLEGDFTTIPYQGSKKPETSGTLGPCKTLPDSEFLCRVNHADFGNGFLALQFDAEGDEFRGLWRSDDEFPSMQRSYWLGLTEWNGFRQE